MIVCVFVATRRSLLCIRAETNCKLPRKLTARSAFTPSCCLCSLHSFLLPMFPSYLLRWTASFTRFASFRISHLILRRERERKAPHDTLLFLVFIYLLSTHLSFALALALVLFRLSVSLPFSLPSLYLSIFLHFFSLFLICFSFCSLCSMLSPLIEVSVTRESKAEVQLIVVIVL